MLQTNNIKQNRASADFGTLIAQATGLLSGSGNSSVTAANLTTEGNADWIHWGDTSLNRKSGVTALLSTYTKVGGGTVSSYTNDLRPLSWTDGTPTATSTNNKNGLYIAGVGSGFSFTAPADTSTRTLTVHLGGWNSGGTLQASLSDGSATNFVDVTTAATGQYDRNYVLSYRAASAGQSLTVRWTMSSGSGNVALNGAALSLTVSSVAVTGVSVSPTTASVAVNATTQLTATIAPANATNQNVTWSSANTAIATVSASGLVTGKAAGSTTITVTTQDGGKTATSTITVSSSSVAVTGVSVNPTTASVAVNATTQLTATIAPANATNQNVTWSSANTAIATVSASGLVTGTAAGSTTITVTTQDGGKTATSTITVVSGTGGAPGTWQTLPYNAPILPIHAALLRTGKIFLFCGSSNNANRLDTPFKSVILDIATGTFSDIPPTVDGSGAPADLFCAGHSFLPDGRLVVASGTYQYDPFCGIDTTFLLDPITQQLTQTGYLNFGRWYPTLVTLGDGRIFAISGFDFDGSLVIQPEIYANSTWTNFSTTTSLFPLYAQMFLMSDGRLFYSGGCAFDSYGVTPRILTLPAQFSQTIAERQVSGLKNAAYTNQAASVLLPPAQDQKVMIIGGGTNGVATKRANVANLSAANPAYVAAASTRYARMHHNAIILPDRTVFVCNGSIYEESIEDSMLPSEIYNPANNTWTTVASQSVPRVYHSVALLLPDGRVFAAGGNPSRTVEELRLEIYTPSYMSQSRPVIQNAPQTVAYGGTITIQTSQASNIKWVNLMRPMATTHSCDTEQRLVDVPFTKQATSLTATVTTNRNLAPPGWYMLSIVNTSNVPSVATWIQLQ